MLMMAPQRFKKVLMLDPVTPLGLALAPGQIDVLNQMKRDRDFAFAGMASAAPSLFRPETMVAGQTPRFDDATTSAQRELFELLIERTRVLSDGVWFGVPHNLALEFESGALAKRMPEMTQEHLVLFGKLDYWVPREHVETMAKALPNCRLEVFPYVGHSMNIEQPLLFARVFSDFFHA
jgi:pimeloyl-ACP methyl ester carboxylesterase